MSSSSATGATSSRSPSPATPDASDDLGHVLVPGDEYSWLSSSPVARPTTWDGKPAAAPRAIPTLSLHDLLQDSAFEECVEGCAGSSFPVLNTRPARYRRATTCRPQTRSLTAPHTALTQAYSASLVCSSNLFNPPNSPRHRNAHLLRALPRRILSCTPRSPSAKSPCTLLSNPDLRSSVIQPSFAHAGHAQGRHQVPRRDPDPCRA
jgi:hypothetical protein